MKGRNKQPQTAVARARRAREITREKAIKLAAKSRRLRRQKALTPPVDGGPAWSHKRGELRGFGPAEQVLALAASCVWREEIKPLLDARDAKSRARQFSSEELELLHFYGGAAGYQTTKEMLEKLSGFWKRQDRRILGFDGPRNPAWRGVKMLNRLDGIPSEATMSRHRLDFGRRLRRQIWERIMEALRAEELAVMDTVELLTLNLDGTHLEIPYMPPLYEKDKDGSPILVDGVPKLKNPGEVTCEDGGVLPKKSHNPGARGFNIIFVATGSGVALAPRIVPISAYEAHVVIPLVEEDLEPLIGDRVRRTQEIGVFSSDGAFSSNRLRKAVRKLGLIENIHFVSHSNEVRAATESKRWMKLGPSGDWWVNGHREVFCDCGNSRATKIFERKQDGSVSCRTEARCATHGFFSVTSAEWVLSGDSKSYSKRNPLIEDENIDLGVGNGLTYNDPLSAVYGKKRFGHHEGFNGALAVRWKLTRGKRYFKNIDQAAIATAIVFSAAYVCGLECRSRRNAAELAVAA